MYCQCLNELCDLFLCGSSNIMYMLSHYYLQSLKTLETLATTHFHCTTPVTSHLHPKRKPHLQFSRTHNINLHHKFISSHRESHFTNHAHAPSRSSSLNHLTGNNETLAHAYIDHAPCEQAINEIILSFLV